ncbi:antiviral reverse transcriptase Drt2 [uncultured Litoreibacter sp.]|uniref:antiviral reverse transcriptase Drt2 n=1 Tax=uncultured Litoreibacter sp. TaxID=1392394 RepID=UPI00262FAA15|nr:antiviral reverse transcriptase Drt2 [uncultured Litoreibacter sp.]
MPGFYLPSDQEFDHKSDDFIEPALSKERRYKHFDLPVASDATVPEFDPSSVGKPHRFLPLLGYTDLTRKYVRDEKSNRKIKIKKRPIRFASHSDASYLQAYSNHLSPLYEAALQTDETSDSVLAYRRGGGTNIHHARSLFDEIRERSDCEVYALDISGFFDCLDHDHLKSEVQRLVGGERLLGHDWSVFNNITKYSWVESEDLDKLLGKKRNRMGRVCSPDDFRQHVRGRRHGLVRTNEFEYGIPQGTPISGLYANLYLRTFDLEVTRMLADIGGTYRRYSDDIAILLPTGSTLKDVVDVIEKMIADFNLAIATEKTEVAHFKNGLLISKKPIQYLGFTYDGQKKLIRPSSLDAYRSKMQDGIHAKLVVAKQQEIPSSEVYKRQLLSRYTHKGKGRNFIQYAYKASDVLAAEEIKDQVKNHIKWFNGVWDREVARVYGGLVTKP